MNSEGYAGFWRRLIAFVIDNLIIHISGGVIVLGLAIAAIMVGFDPFQAQDVIEDVPDSGGAFYAAIAMLSAMQVGYFVYFHGRTGQTPGKKLLGVKVVRISGAAMTYGVAFLRWVGYIISGLFLYLGFIWIAFDRKKQGWHDKIAGTYVINIQNSEDRSEFKISYMAP